ncbi:MAG: ribonuclease catalytic domain-containing protein [Omnitrophica WOR_2 bacterium]
MMDTTLRPDSLVLYKKRPALIRQPTGDKLEIELQDGASQKVRPKDVVLLHPGPFRSLAGLRDILPGEVEAAWEILAGQETTLPELAELIYAEFTPATAWSTWLLIEDGLYFHGAPEKVTARTQVEVSNEKAMRQRRLNEELNWAALLGRVRTGKIFPEDRENRYIRELVDLAMGKRTDSRILRELGIPELPEKSHALLLNLGIWGVNQNPYPSRSGVALQTPEISLGPIHDEDRLDLTYLRAFAIDDEGNQEPDDAINLEGNRLWVHVADVAALVSPYSPIDLEARARGASLYLPEGTVQMLPEKAIQKLGLGLSEVSPALSFGIDFDADGEISQLSIQPSRVCVQRLTYPQVEEQIENGPFKDLYQLSLALRERRRKNGAVFIELPEVKIDIHHNEVYFRTILPLRSRMIVEEAMLIAGEAAARFAIDHQIPFPFAVQNPSSGVPASHFTKQEDMAGMFALRRLQNRSRVSHLPGPHTGLGLSLYSRVTSPLRRYLDLVAHQQLRAYQTGGFVLGEQEIVERIGAADAITGSVNQAEALSRRHWTLVYLMRHPEWRGEGIVVEKRGLRAKIILPEFALEVEVDLPHEILLNNRVTLSTKGVNLAELDVSFKVLESQVASAT